MPTKKLGLKTGDTVRAAYGAGYLVAIYKTREPNPYKGELGKAWERGYEKGCKVIVQHGSISAKVADTTWMNDI